MTLPHSWEIRVKEKGKALKRVLEGEPGRSLPFAPFVGAHAARVMGISSQQMYADPNKLALSILSVLDLYELDGLSVGFDLSVESDRLRTGTLWSERWLPDWQEPTHRPVPGARPRLEVVREAMHHVARKLGGDLCILATVAGPQTLAWSLAPTSDTEVADASAVDSAMIVIQESIQAYGTAVDFVVVIDPLLAHVSTADFEAFLAGPYARICALAHHYGMSVGLYPGSPPDGGPGLKRYAAAGLDCLLVPAVAVGPEDLNENMLPLGLCVSPALFSESPDRIQSCARELGRSWSGKPAFVTTLGEVPYACSPTGVRNFIDALRAGE